jgi:signal transduction histidine kinase
MRISIFIHIILFFLLFNGFAYRNIAQEEDIQKQINDSLAFFKKNTDKIDFYVRLSDRFFLTNAQLSKEYAHKAIQLSQENKYQEGEIKGLLALGYIEQFSNPSQANRYFTEAKDKAENMKYFALLFEAYYYLANFYLKWEQYDPANQCIQKQIALVKDKNLKQTPNYGLLGGIYAKQGKTAQAIAAYEKQVQLQLARNEEKFTTGTLSDAGNAYFYVKEYEKAREYYLKGIAIGEKYQDDRSLGYLKDNIGLSFYEQKRYKEALPWQTEALIHRRKLNSEHEVIAGLNNLSATYLALGKSDSALLLARESYPLALKFGHYNFIREISEILGKTYYALKNTDSAYIFMQKAHAYQDSLRKQERERALLGALARLEAEEQKYQNSLLTQQNEQLLSFGIWLTLLSIIILVISLALWKQSQARRKLLMYLQELNATKDKLFAILGHDLRAPIASLVNVMEMLNTDMISPKEFLFFSTKLKEDVKYVHFTLNNLLIWANSQMRGLKTNTQNIELQELINENISLFSTIASAKNIHISHEVPTNACIKADKDQIDLVLRNLISNALKFTPQYGKIHISVSSQDSFWKISVKDTGVGISPERLAKLFVQDNYFSSLGTGGEKGTGFGLMLCKEMVEQNGGKIWVESQEGKGSTFNFTLAKWV